MSKVKRRVERIKELAAFHLSRALKGFDVSEDPHFDDESTSWFTEKLRHSKLYLEFGAGGSTLLADRLGKQTISVENDTVFAAAVKKRLSGDKHVKQITVRIGLTGPWGVPVLARPNTARIKKWLRYIEAPYASGVLLGVPDLVLVDGRFRRACALMSTLHAQHNHSNQSILFDDYFNDDRENYSPVEVLLGQPQKIGRAAVFETIDAKPVTRKDVLEAAADFR
jgi:hypothetical protein